VSIETVRINAQGREQLSRLKRYTGIEHYNELRRWALCISLAETTRPPITKTGSDKGIDMSWRTFAGAQAELYLALLKQRCVEDGLGSTPETLNEQLRLHIQRGLGYLTGRKIRSITDLVSIAALAA
jgi:DNA sulfur modification protein DndE